MATSHFEPDDKAYLRLLDKQRSLDLTHQVNIALVHAAILASHLRHGFQDLYKRDLVLMRQNNVPDYPCLCFAMVVSYSRATYRNIKAVIRTIWSARELSKASSMD